MLDPIVKEIDVPCDPATAFDVFLKRMGGWWPLDRFSVSAMLGGPSRSLRVESREGGAILEVAADGSEHVWGRITAYEPPGRLAMDFHIPHPEHSPADRTGDFTRVDLEFTPRPDGGTQVRLTQTGWEALRDMAEPAREGYGAAWSAIFEDRYRAACERTT
jgi:uncharacterized protein YndB with AHSA1/START domain